jgi:hypothetical protein
MSTLNNGGGYGNAKLASAATVDSFLMEPSDPGQAIGFWSRRLLARGLCQAASGVLVTTVSLEPSSCSIRVVTSLWSC